MTLDDKVDFILDKLNGSEGSELRTDIQAWLTAEHSNPVDNQLMTYYKGERLEAILLAVFGLLTIGIAVVMWQYINQNQMLKGLFYPIAFLGAFTLLAGSFNAYNNNQRLDKLPIQYSANQKEFVQTELKRFEGNNGVNKWWMPLKVTWAILVIAGLILSFTTKSELTNGIAIGLILIGAMGFIIDGFAHQRAKIYTTALTSQ